MPSKEFLAFWVIQLPIFFLSGALFHYLSASLSETSGMPPWAAAGTLLATAAILFTGIRLKA